MKMKIVTYASQESSPQIRKSSSQEVCQAWNRSPMASLQGEDLYLLSGFLRKLLDIGNVIHPRHWNLKFDLVTHPNIISTKRSPISVGLGLLQSCPHFSKKEEIFQNKIKE